MTDERKHWYAIESELWSLHRRATALALLPTVEADPAVALELERVYTALGRAIEATAIAYQGLSSTPNVRA